MISRWAGLALRRKDVPDVILIGTDPIFSVLIAPVWRFFHPETKIAHWCFDLYPEAAYADGVMARGGALSRVFTAALKRSYLACDLVVNIGNCMRRLLLEYDPGMCSATLVPWALSEPNLPLPVPPEERSAVFGETILALMYSGSFGRAHGHEDILDLMRHLRDSPVKLALSVKGNREESLRSAIGVEDINISFVPFAPATLLEQRLASADIHIVSLRKEWTGTVVPSKFFGALAVGRPVLFCGSRDSSLAEWIEKYGLGWVLEPGNAAAVAESLRLLLMDDASLQSMKERCFRVYHQHFSRTGTIDEWNRRLSPLLAERQSQEISKE
jgi:glycosyltransferase involved in cell wall biosynthesis